MGRASNAKKAARLARESGDTADRPKRRLGYPLAVLGAVVVGVIVVVIARQPAETKTPTLDVPTADTLVDGATEATTDTTIVIDSTVPASDTTVTTAAP